MRKLHLLVIVPVLALAFGCGQDRPQKPNIEGGLRKRIPVLDRTISLQQLNAIGMGYRLMSAEGRTPRTIEELEPYYENRKITQAINDGAIVVILGVNPDKQPGETILAYTQEPDAQGEHVVLLCNLTVQAMTAKTFEAAPKAQAR
jgi:hypothetical protein